MPCCSGWSPPSRAGGRGGQARRCAALCGAEVLGKSLVQGGPPPPTGLPLVRARMPGRLLRFGHGLAWRRPRQEVLRRMQHAVKLDGWRHGMATSLRLPELRGQVELQVKSLHRLCSLPTTAVPLGVVFLLVGVVVEFRSCLMCVVSSSPGEKLSSIGSGRRWRTRYYLVEGVALEFLAVAVRRVRRSGGTCLCGRGQQTPG